MNQKKKLLGNLEQCQYIVIKGNISLDPFSTTLPLLLKNLAATAVNIQYN